MVNFLPTLDALLSHKTIPFTLNMYYPAITCLVAMIILHTEDFIIYLDIIIDVDFVPLSWHFISVSQYDRNSLTGSRGHEDPRGTK